MRLATTRDQDERSSKRLVHRRERDALKAILKITKRRDLRPLTTSSHPVDASRKHMDLIIKLGCDRFVRVFPCGCHGYENYPTILDNITPSYSV